MPDPATLLSRLTALSDQARLRIMRQLEKHELSVGELSRALQLPQSTVSRHLKLLFDGHWIVRRTSGTASLYRLLDDALDGEARELWTLTRQQLGASAAFQDDDHRLAAVLAERSAETESYFGRLGDDWTEVRGELFGDEFTTSALVSLAAANWTVADIGCGTGQAAALLAPWVDRVIAIDREPTMIAAARTRLANFANVEFREGDIETLPLDDHEVDAAIVFLVMHHLTDPAAAVKEIVRGMKPNGLLMVVDMVAHDREAYRQTMGHQHLGFDEAHVQGWADGAGLGDLRYRRLRPDTNAKGPGLFVARMRKTAE